MDKISQLPQPIQHHILSFLEQPEVGQTACLSKTWGSILQSRPVLVFNFEPKPYSYVPKSDIEKREWESLLGSKERIFINHVEKSIQRIVGQDLSIQRFSLEAEFYGPDRHKAELDRWVQQLVEAKVKDLNLLLKFSKPYHYMLPPVVFLSETLTSLWLSSCDLERCRNVRMPNLLELSLELVSLSQETVAGFASGCPNLEILKLDWCRGLSSIHVSGLDRLTTIELNLKRTVTKVKIVAPRLRVFNISSTYPRRTDLPILLACESSLRKFKLGGVYVYEKDLESLVSRFLELEELILSNVGVASIKIPNQKIRKLNLTRCRNLETVDINAPNLRDIEYYYNKLHFYSMNSSFSPNNIIDFRANCYVDPSKIWTDSLKNSLKDMFKFGGLKNMKLMVKFRGSMDVFVFQELDEEFINMSYDGKDPRIPRMTIEVMHVTTHKHMANHLFKCGNRWENVDIISRDQKSRRNFVKVLNENILKENEESHYCIPRIRHWQRSLQHAEIVNGKIKKPDFMKPFDTTKCRATRIKLQWN